MTALVVLTVLCLVGGGTSVYYERKRDEEEYRQYMANRVSFACEELTAKTFVDNSSEVNSEK